jgi:hypothetical protein
VIPLAVLQRSKLKPFTPLHPPPEPLGKLKTGWKSPLTHISQTIPWSYAQQ